jgi:hypothetical protein
MTDAATWIHDFALAASATELSEHDRQSILALAGVAAHSSERLAAPLTCWVAAAAGLSPDAALEIARSVAATVTNDVRASDQ